MKRKGFDEEEFNKKVSKLYELQNEQDVLEEQLHQIQIELNAGIDVNKLENGEQIQKCINWCKVLLCNDTSFGLYNQSLDEAMEKIQPKEIKEYNQAKQDLEKVYKWDSQREKYIFDCDYEEFILLVTPCIFTPLIFNFNNILVSEIIGLILGFTISSYFVHKMNKEYYFPYQEKEKNKEKLYQDKGKIKKLLLEYLKKKLIDSNVEQIQINKLLEYFQNYDFRNREPEFQKNKIETLLEESKKQIESLIDEIKVDIVLRDKQKNDDCQNFYAIYRYSYTRMWLGEFYTTHGERSGFLTKISDDCYYDVLLQENVKSEDVIKSIALKIDLDELIQAELQDLLDKIDNELEYKSEQRGYGSYGETATSFENIKHMDSVKCEKQLKL